MSKKKSDILTIKNLKILMAAENHNNNRIYGLIFVSAFFDGIFTGAYIRTGIDASPSGIGIQIIDAISKILPSGNEPLVEFLKILIFIIPWIVTAILILIAQDRRIGLIIWGIIFVFMLLLVGFY